MLPIIPNLSTTTELEAVNSILAASGESPINSLSDEFDDGFLAYQLLLEETRAAQLADWSFNTDLDVTLQATDEGEMLLPKGTFRLVVSCNTDLVMRGQRVYDRRLQTFEFTPNSTITADVIRYYLPFEYLPDALRIFITIRAGRRFQDRMGGDTAVHRFNAEDERMAWAAALADEAEAAQLNMLDSNYLAQRLKFNRGHYSRLGRGA